MISYNMQELGTQLRLQENLFITRVKGEAAYAVLAAQLENLPEGECLVLDFPDNQLMDGSFADEAIVRLAEAVAANQFGQRRFVLKGLTTDSIDNLTGAIQRRKIKPAVIHVSKSLNWKVIGHIEPSLREVLEMLSTRDRLTAPELVQELNLALNTANNRLKRLHDQGLIQREYEVSEKGLLYYYYFPKYSIMLRPNDPRC